MFPAMVPIWASKLTNWVNDGLVDIKNPLVHHICYAFRLRRSYSSGRTARANCWRGNALIFHGIGVWHGKSEAIWNLNRWGLWQRGERIRDGRKSYNGEKKVQGIHGSTAWNKMIQRTRRVGIGIGPNKFSLIVLAIRVVLLIVSDLCDLRAPTRD